MAKKMHVGIKVAAVVGATGAAVAAGAVTGNVAKIDAGWKRVLIGLGFTGLVTTVLAIIKPTRGAALWTALGGTVGSLALFGQSAAGRWIERMKAKKASAQQQRVAVSVPGVPPQIPAAQPSIPTVIVQKPAPVGEPTVLQQVTPLVTSLFDNLARMGGSIWGGGASWRSGGTGTRFAGGTGTRFAGGTGTRFAGGTGRRYRRTDQRQFNLANQ